MKYMLFLLSERLFSKSGGTTNSIWKFFSVFLFMFLSNPPVFAAIIFNSNFDTGEFISYGWKAQGVQHVAIEKDSASNPIPVCLGYVAKFNINFNDSFNYRDMLSLSVGPAGELKIGSEYWFGFSVFLPTSWEPDTADDVIWQLHGRPDLDRGEGYRKPVLALRTNNDEWYITYSKDSKTNTGEQGNSIYEDRGRFSLGLFETGKWTNFVVNTKYTYNTEGFVKVYMNGDLIYSKTGGIGYNDKMGAYLTIGLYKSTWKLSSDYGKATNVSSRTIYFDEIKIGDVNSSLDEVSPECLAVPVTPTGLKLIRN